MQNLSQTFQRMSGKQYKSLCGKCYTLIGDAKITSGMDPMENATYQIFTAARLCHSQTTTGGFTNLEGDRMESGGCSRVPT